MPDFSARWNLLINSTDASTVCQDNERLHSKNGAAASEAIMVKARCGNSSKINEKPVVVKKKISPVCSSDRAMASTSTAEFLPQCNSTLC